ncbi:Gfo/Idh/MocA family protein [Cohnella silvisoli]|uniref:Gfo/Idh/MocA family oxidoreductase n=1 Tax=Cohnella silvisoli TaxID=2873699 RepID=A0ABV1KQI7_9BACL|nr:Gfo/Idh/MocA family oxidoreductase [Cohnella silvisoli]MCD9022018.1 Gfo/Idh/MocA family oxidoreductase [Cohnella silvisoli]
MLKLGVVGLGLGMTHVDAAQQCGEEVALVAICDANRDRLQAVNGDIRRFTDYGTFLRESGADALVLAVPHDLHAKMTLEAMEHGKHVLLEKPMSTSVADGERMVASAKERGLSFMIAQNWRYTPWCRQIKSIIDSGELGNIRMIRSDWVLNFHDFYPKGTWIYDGQRGGGGAVIGLVVHNLDYLRFLFGEVRKVYAQHLYTDEWSSNRAENMSMIQFEFESGALGQMLTSYTPFINQDSGPLQVYGDQGMLTAKRMFPEHIYVTSSSRTSAEKAVDRRFDEVSVEPGEPFAVTQLRHFAECVKTGNKPISSGEDNLGTIRLVESIYESARTGEPVLVGCL